MYGYIFEAINTKTGEKYIGKRYAVGFDKNYLGEENNTALAVAIEKYGRPSFSAKMLMPYDSKDAVDSAYESMVKVEKPKKIENPVKPVEEVEEPIEPEEEKPVKKGRKKKTEDE